VQYRLFVDLEAIEFLVTSNFSLRRKLVAHLSKIEAFPESRSDYFENDSKGRRIDIAICSANAIHYLIDFADPSIRCAFEFACAEAVVWRDLKRIPRGGHHAGIASASALQ
jgi:hypothetical protein